MKQTAILAFAFFFATTCAFAQHKNVKTKQPKLIEKIEAILSPTNGRESDADPAYSAKVNEKYQIKSFEFHKINALDGSDCNFVYFDGSEYFPMSLNVGNYYGRDIYNEKKTYYANVQYVKYFRNNKNAIASKVKVIYYIYKSEK